MLCNLALHLLSRNSAQSYTTPEERDGETPSWAKLQNLENKSWKSPDPDLLGWFFWKTIIWWCTKSSHPPSTLSLTVASPGPWRTRSRKGYLQKEHAECDPSPKSFPASRGMGRVSVTVCVLSCWAQLPLRILPANDPLQHHLLPCFFFFIPASCANTDLACSAVLWGTPLQHQTIGQFVH